MGCNCGNKKKYTVVHAIKDSAKEVLGLNETTTFVSDEIYQERVNTCRNCPAQPRSNYSSTFDLCKLCGCFIAAKAKFKDSFCDAGIWGSIDD